MIEATAIATACAGVAMLAGLFGRLRVADADRRLKRHRSKDAALPDELNYAAEIDDGIVVNKDAGFLAAWLYRCEDQASSPERQREAIVFRINQALAPLGSGWMLNVDAVRRAAPGYPPPSESDFPDRVSLAIDEERRRYFETLGNVFEGYFVVTLTWLPPVLAKSKFVELMFDDEALAPDHTTRTYMLLERFKQQIAGIESRLSSALSMTRLRGQKIVQEDGSTVTQDDLLSWLQYCITGIHQPMLLPSNPAYLDTLLGGQDFITGTIPKIGRKFIQCIAIDGFPMESTPGILQAVAELACDYRWSSRFILMDQHEALSHLEKFRKKWRQKMRGLFDQIFNTNAGGINQDAANMAADAEAAKAEVSSGLVADGYYTSVVVLMNEDRDKLELLALEVQKAIQKLGFGARIESLNNMDAFFGSLPGHGVQNVRRPLINTMNLADFLPTSTIWTGNPRAPCPMYPKKSPALLQCVTHGSTPFRLNLHVRQLGHTLIFGPTRAGKSTLVGLLAAQLRRYLGMSLYIFESGMSAYPLTKAVGGRHYVVGGDTDKLQFAPLQHLETRADRAWAMRWIDHVLALNGLDTTANQRNAIAKAVVSMDASGSHTLSDFVTTVQDEVIRTALEQYTVNGSMGHLFDAEQDGLTFSSFCTFEIKELMELGEKYAVPALLYLFRRIERSLTGQPAAIFLDEAWLMLDHPVFRQWVRKWLKTMAKANCAVVLSTQNLSDAAMSGIFDVMVESTATKILLPNPHAGEAQAAELYRRIGLNERQIQIVAEAKPRQYYLMSEAGNRLFELALGPLALSFVGVTDFDSIATIQQLETRHGEAWVDHWLARHKLKLDDFVEAA